jgi:hypothetical protein
MPILTDNVSSVFDFSILLLILNIEFGIAVIFSIKAFISTPPSSSKGIAFVWI